MTTSSPPVASSFRQPTASVAPWWHTVLLVAIILAFSVYQGQAHTLPRAASRFSLVPIYGATMGYEISLVVYIWLFGLRPRGVGIRDIVGGKWNHFTDFLRDLKTAFLFWIVVVAVLAVVRYLVRYNGIEGARLLLPQSRAEVATFVILSVTAGFCEEFIFRGYLQRQFLALANRAWIAIVLQALVFGSAHLYQGMRAVIAITVYGALFGILAWRRNSLRPGMMQHAAQDSFSGIAASILIKHKII